MTTTLTAKSLAQLITALVTGPLARAIEWRCTAAEVPAVARSIGEAAPAEVAAGLGCTAAEVAKVIGDSVAASLSQALALACTARDVPAIAKAIGGNAGMALYLEACERGVLVEE